MGSRARARSEAVAASPVSDWADRVTRAEVDLDAIAHNVRTLRATSIAPRLMAVVKANAYGHGAQMVATVALEAGADALGVYAVQEGLCLRDAGIRAPILVFGPFGRSEATDIVSAGLTPTLTSLMAAREIQDAAGDTPVAFHLKIDTGLSRAGIHPSEAVNFMRAMAGFPSLQSEGIYTHFVSADERSKETTHRQLRIFLDTVRDLEAAGFPFHIRHAANSAGTLDVPDAHLDIVRAGIALYGYHPSPDVARVDLRPALRLVSTLSRVHEISTGTGVGYGHEFRATRPTRLGLAPIGYGDGLPRSLGNGRGSVIVNGHAAPIVGRVSMDQITIDVTDVPPVSVGDAVTLIGTDGEVVQTADDLAQMAGTISYDILTGLLPRVPRFYLRGGELVGTLTMRSYVPQMPNNTRI